MQHTPQQGSWILRNWISKTRPAGANVALLFVILLATFTSRSAQAQTFTVRHEFDGTDGSNAYGGLVQATNGSLYGTTTEGGAYNDSSCIGDTTGCGTVFKITPTGVLTTIYSFCAQSGCPDGQSPIGTLVQAANGNLYGTTYTGGTNTCKFGATNSGCGTFFQITPAGVLTTLHNFAATEAYGPGAALVQGANGNFYGTAVFYGGTADGAVFEVTPTGKVTTLYAFCQTDCTDGASPHGALMLATNGFFYGTTAGGAPYGTVFKISPAGVLTTLHRFEGADGNGSFAALIQANDGNLYGTTEQGGTSTACSFGCGTVFKITPAGVLTTLHNFDSTDGAVPWAGLVQGTDGNFYGTTSTGGANDDGTIFKITTAGVLTTLHNFDHTDGNGAYAGLTQATNGTFYGTTEFGGNHNGVVFSLANGLGAFVEARPGSGKVAAAVKILGSNLTGATDVTFNGTSATFNVLSSSNITTTVPAGATTGKISVVTPTKTFTSNVAFRVTPQLSSFAPAGGPAQTVVTIAGVSLKQASQVTFGGIKATTFSVKSDTSVVANVPAGAVTGKIVITTPGGTATSATAFSVTE